MPEQRIIERIEKLEQRVDLLEKLPGRLDAIELELVQQRREMHDGFSALRGEIRALGDDLRGEMRGTDESLRGEIRALGDDLRAEMHALHHLSSEKIEAGNAESQRYMRVMVEELLTRIKTMGEGRRTKKKR